MKQITVFVLIACLVAGLFCGCSSEEAPYVPTGDGLTWDEDPGHQTESTEPPKEQEFSMVYYADKTMNPYQCIDFTNRALFSLIYQGLFATNREYQAVPILCKRYTVSTDMRTYTFYIENATFSNGAMLTIDDVLASYQAAMESTVYKGRFLHVNEVSLSADGGITFRLDTAYENFPLLLDIPILQAEEIAADRPLGTGPYYMESTVAGQRLRRRSNWWCQADIVIKATSIPLVEAVSNTQIRDEFQFGDVGLVCADPGSDSYADYRSDYELWDCESGDFLYLACNVEGRLFSNPQVRAALTYAIDRDHLVTKYFRGFAHSATLPASPLSPYYNTNLAAKYTYDPDRFAEALNASGLTGTTIRVLVNHNDTLRLRIAREIAAMLEQHGLLIEMRECSGKDYKYYLASGGFDLFIGQTRLSANMDLSAFFASNGALRYGGLPDASIYTMCLESLANQGNYYTLHQMIAADGRLCPVLFQNYSIHATRGLITDLSPSRDNIFSYSIGKTLSGILS